MKKTVLLFITYVLTFTSFSFFPASAKAIEPASMEISAQDYHSCAINNEGYVSCWGSNTTGATSVPQDLGKVSQVSLGGDSFNDHSCALIESGSLRCWGSNDTGQINVPNDLGKVRQFDAGGKHTCAINDYSQLRCWGRSEQGQISVPIDLGPVDQVSAGQWNTCVITESKSVRCWGSNASGQLNVPYGLGEVAQVSVGSEHVCALKTNGQLRCWGYWWQSGSADLTSELGKYTQVSSGPWNTCAVSADNHIDCWGYNAATLNSAWTRDGGQFRQVAAGLNHACAFKSNGDLVCYGDNSWDQLQIPQNFRAGFSSSSEINAVNLPGTSSFYYLNMNRTNWETAATQAASLNFRGQSGHLANITSSAENNFISALLAEESVNWGVDHAWFGAKADTWPDFRFNSGPESGQSLSYTNWGAGEPNGHGSWKEDFAVVRPDGTWNDYCNCDGLWSVVEFYIPSSPDVNVVTYSLNGGSGYDPVQPPLPDGSTFVIADTPTRAGYTFVGWSDGEVTYQAGSNYTIENSGVNFSATWAVNTYELTFDSNGGSPVSNGSFATGGWVNSQSQPNRAGYSFLGWYESFESNAVSFPYKPNVTRDVTLYALWTPNVSVSVSTLSEHSCAVINGGVKCWGYNSSGQLGDGTTNNTSIPVTALAAGSGVTEVASGRDHTCAVVQGGVKCWGANYDGQLGDGTREASLTPTTAIVSGSGVTSVSTGDFNTCAVVDGGVQCWGANFSGQLGDGTIPLSTVPISAIVAKSGVTSVSVRDSHVCAMANGGVKCWGYNYKGQLGDGTTNDSTSPVIAIPEGSGVTSVSAGDFHTCAVVNGGVQCWGYNGSGQLGDGRSQFNTLDMSTTPVVAISSGSGVIEVSSGNVMSCAVLVGGVQCWGYSWANQLGPGANDFAKSPISTIAAGSAVTSVSVGDFHTCVVAAGAVKCWGYNRFGQLGDGTSGDMITPVSSSRFANLLILTYFQNNGSDLPPVETSVSHGSTISIAEKPEKSGYVFAGWSDGVALYQPGSNLVVGQSDVELTAIWLEVHTLTFDAKGGSAIPVASFVAGDLISAPNDPIRPGYTFVGWSDTDGGIALSFPYSPSVLEDTTLYALWAPKTYTIKYVYNSAAGQVLHSSSSFTTGNSPILLPTPRRTGYAFAGWYGDTSLTSKIGDGGSVFSPFGNNTSLNVFAKWTKKFSKVIIPALKGVPKVGHVIYTAGSPMGAGVSYSHQWLRNGVAIAGAVDRKYVLTPDDLGAILHLRVCGAKYLYETTCVVGTNANVVDLGELSRRSTVSLTSTSNKVGDVLEGRTTSWEADVELSYSWLRDGVEIEGEYETTYQLIDDDRKHSISFKVLAQKPGYKDVIKTSRAKRIP